MEHLTVHIELIEVELPPAGMAALLSGSMAELRAAVAAAVLNHQAVRDSHTSLHPG